MVIHPEEPRSGSTTPSKRIYSAFAFFRRRARDASYSGFDAPETTQTWGTPYLHGFVTLPVAEANLNLVPLSAVDWDTTINETCAQARFSTVKVSSGKQQRVELQGVVHWDLKKP